MQAKVRRESRVPLTIQTSPSMSFTLARVLSRWPLSLLWAFRSVHGLPSSIDLTLSLLGYSSSQSFPHLDRSKLAWLQWHLPVLPQGFPLFDAIVCALWQGPGTECLCSRWRADSFPRTALIILSGSRSPRTADFSKHYDWKRSLTRYAPFEPPK